MSDYLAIDLSTGADVAHYPVLASDAAPSPADDAARTTQLWLRKIPAGVCVMGSPEGEAGRYGNETRHRVTIGRDFWLGVFPVTQRQWELVMGSNPAYFKTAGPCAPVEMVTYLDICCYCRPWPYGGALPESSFLGKLRLKTGLPGLDLPTDAQWEYACRAGCGHAFYTGRELDDVTACRQANDIAWYEGNSGGSTHAVGQKMPNHWGLHDMLGNVWEWCRDWYENPAADAVVDPIGPAAGFSRAMRGGSWFHRAGECRCALRYDDDEARRSKYLGFRLALDGAVAVTAG